MPVPITKYRCQFKCGAHAKDSKKAMESHEAGCWNNPANRACRSCKHERYGKDGDGYTEGVYYLRECLSKEGNEVLEKAYDLLKVSVNGQVKPIFHCQFWESKQ